MKNKKPSKNSLVVKENKVIEQISKFNLQEMRLIAFCLAHLDEKSNSNKPVIARVDDLIDIFPIDRKYAYDVVKRVMLSFGKKPLEVKVDNRRVYRNWFSGFDYIEGSGTFIFKINEDITPYLLQLKGNFTKYRLQDVYQFNQASTWKLYEILKRWEYKKEWIVELVELKSLLNIANNYPVWADLQKRVLVPATKQINATSDLLVSYDKIKTGRKVSGLSFSILSKSESQTVEESPDKNHLIKALADIGIKEKTVREYIYKIEAEGKVALILGKLPAMIKRAGNVPLQKYILGAINNELAQGNLFESGGVDYAERAELFKQALACMERKKTCVRRSQKNKKICDVCKTILGK